MYGQERKTDERRDMLTGKGRLSKKKATVGWKVWN
jgi:hypothetical protein